MRRLLHHLAVHRPAGALVSQHAAGHLAHSVGSEGGVALQDAGQVSQQVIEECWHAFITWWKVTGQLFTITKLTEVLL